MSASDEKQLDEAITLATEFAQMNTLDVKDRYVLILGISNEKWLKLVFFTGMFDSDEDPIHVIQSPRVMRYKSSIKSFKLQYYIS